MSTIVTNDSPSEFDYDAFPATGELKAIRANGFATNEWEPAVQLDRPTRADDPLTATFSDLDLAPARLEVLKNSELDDSYWVE